MHAATGRLRLTARGDEKSGCGERQQMGSGHCGSAMGCSSDGVGATLFLASCRVRRLAWMLRRVVHCSEGLTNGRTLHTFMDVCNHRPGRVIGVGSIMVRR